MKYRGIWKINLEGADLDEIKALYEKLTAALPEGITLDEGTAQPQGPYGHIINGFRKQRLENVRILEGSEIGDFLSGWAEFFQTSSYGLDDDQEARMIDELETYVLHSILPYVEEWREDDGYVIDNLKKLAKWEQEAREYWIERAKSFGATLGSQTQDIENTPPLYEPFIPKDPQLKLSLDDK